MSVQGWLRKSSPGMLLRIVARQVSDETLSLRLAVTGPALSPARLEASWNVLDWESGPRWQFWIFALRVWRSAALDCWPDPWGTWSLSKSHPAWLQISVGKTDGHDDKATSIQDEVQEHWHLNFASFHYCYIKNRTHLDDSVLFLKRTTTDFSGEKNTHNWRTWSGRFDAWTRVLSILGHLGVQNILLHHF